MSSILLLIAAGTTRSQSEGSGWANLTMYTYNFF